MAGKYDDLGREQLVALLEKRDREKKLGLVWERDEIEADAAIDRNFVACEIVPELSEKAAPWRNLVIEGDNYDALRWLRMAYAGKVKAIYIDPPYNTGNKDWVYNDHYVDRDDRYRHSTWLEFLYRRLTLARDLLTDDGVILVSINDEQRAKLELLMDEVLPGMRVGSLVWRTKDSSNDAERNLSSVHEHVLVYGRGGFSFLGYLLDKSKYSNRDNDPRGDYSLDPITKAHDYIDRPNTYYPIQDPKTGWWYPCNPDSVWRFASEDRETTKKRLRSDSIEELIRQDRIWFSATECVEYDSTASLLKAIDNGMGPKDGKGRQLLRADLPDINFWVNRPIGLGRPSQKAFWEEKTSQLKPISSWIAGSREKLNLETDHIQLQSDKQGKGGEELKALFGRQVFQYPKPVSLIRELLRATVDKNDLVLDFFAGSATTAQAVMELNAEDGGDRCFIMVSSTEATTDEPEKNLCRDVTSERIRRLNAADGKYDEVAAEFAYLRTVEIDFEDMDYELTPDQAWTALEAMHGLPLTIYDAGRSWNAHEGEDTVLVLVDQPDAALAEWLAVRVKQNLFVYGWAPGQVEALLGDLGVTVLPLRQTLVKRFMA